LVLGAALPALTLRDEASLEIGRQK